MKTQFCFHTDSDLLMINGRVVPAARERSNAAEVGLGALGQEGGGPADARHRGVAGEVRPPARLPRSPRAARDMDALGTDQVMLFPTWFVRLALLRDAERGGDPRRAPTTTGCYDYCAADRARLFPCAVLPLQSVEASIAELRRVAKLGLQGGRRPALLLERPLSDLPEFDPLWREFEATRRRAGHAHLPLARGAHAGLGRSAWRRRADTPARGSCSPTRQWSTRPGQFVSNITAAMDPAIDASETLGFLMEAMTWVTVVVQTGWLEKFPRLKAAVLESNASWLPLVLPRASNFSNLFAFQRGNRLIRDPVEIFHERCFIGFESDETLVYRLWDEFKDVAIWSSDYPHHDAEDAWDGLAHMAEFDVPAEVQQKLLGENARRLYGIEPLMVVKERIEHYEPAILAW